MLNTLFEQSLRLFNTKREALEMGLIGLKDLSSTDSDLAVDYTNKENMCIPERSCPPWTERMNRS